jgi:hypothetical protein
MKWPAPAGAPGAAASACGEERRAPLHRTSKERLVQLAALGAQVSAGRPQGGGGEIGPAEREHRRGAQGRGTRNRSGGNGPAVRCGYEFKRHSFDSPQASSCVG